MPPVYTAEERAWLARYGYEHRNSFETAKAFEEHFGYPRSAYGIKSALKRFCPGRKYGHSGGKPKGQGSSTTARSVGSRRKVGGYWYVKISSKPLPKHYDTADLRECWVQEHRYLWETATGKRVPRGSVVIFLDGDRDHVTLDNLYCTKRSVIFKMIRNKWFTSDAEHTLTAIKLCELQLLLSRKENRGEDDDQ